MARWRGVPGRSIDAPAFLLEHDHLGSIAHATVPGLDWPCRHCPRRLHQQLFVLTALVVPRIDQLLPLRCSCRRSAWRPRARARSIPCTARCWSRRRRSSRPCRHRLADPPHRQQPRRPHYELESSVAAAHGASVGQSDRRCQIFTRRSSHASGWSVVGLVQSTNGLRSSVPACCCCSTVEHRSTASVQRRRTRRGRRATRCTHIIVAASSRPLATAQAIMAVVSAAWICRHSYYRCSALAPC